MHRPYSTQSRLSLCEACSAPLEVPVEGGTLPCPRCGHANAIGPRRSSATLPRSSAPVDEATRLARLRAQDGQPFVPPESLRRLLRGSSFDPARVDEALAVYRATCKEVRATSSPDAAERLYFLTLIASNHYYEGDDHRARSALLETSLDHVFLPRHEQVIRTMLASAAARSGDLASAEQWLAPCNPHAEDIESDSAYRAARAFIDTVNRNYRRVLDTLGRQDDEIPIHDARDPVCAVLRANALERLGDPAGAVAVLRARMGKENAAGRAAMERLVADNRELSLCELSFPDARRGHNEVAAKAAAGMSGGGTGTVLMVMGGVSLLLGVVMAVAVPVPGLLERFTMMIGPGIAAIVMIPLGYALRNSAREAAYLRQHGLTAQGTIVALKPTGTKINGVPVVRVVVTIRRRDAGPYQAEFKQLLGAELRAQLLPGVEVPLRVHPQKPEKVILELL